MMRKEEMSIYHELNLYPLLFDLTMMEKRLCFFPLQKSIANELNIMIQKPNLFYRLVNTKAWSHKNILK